MQLLRPFRDIDTDCTVCPAVVFLDGCPIQTEIEVPRHVLEEPLGSLRERVKHHQEWVAVDKAVNEHVRHVANMLGARDVTVQVIWSAAE